MFIEMNMMITFFIYFQETYNNRLRERCGDYTLTHPRFDPDLWMEVGSSGGPDKNRVTGSPTLRPTTCGRPVVLQLLGAPYQYRALNLRSSWPCSNTRLSSPKSTTTYQRRTHNSKNNKEWHTNNSKNNTARSLNNKERPMKSFVKWSWTWHKLEHVRPIFFGSMTASLLLLLQLHLYINF